MIFSKAADLSLFAYLDSLIIYIKQYLCWLSVCLSLNNTCSFWPSLDPCSRTSWQQFHSCHMVRGHYADLPSDDSIYLTFGLLPIPTATKKGPALYQHVLLSVLFSREQALINFLSHAALLPPPEPWIKQIILNLRGT